MENGLKLCSHSFYGDFIVVGELDKTPVKKNSPLLRVLDLIVLRFDRATLTQSCFPTLNLYRHGL